MASIGLRLGAWVAALPIAITIAAAGPQPLAHAATASYRHVQISEESICVSYTATFMRAVIALAKSNEIPPTPEMIDQVKLAADELSLLAAQAPADFAANLNAVRAAFTEGHAILASGNSGRFSDPQGSRTQLLSYVSRCQKYPLTTLPGLLRPPDPQGEGGIGPSPAEPTQPAPDLPSGSGNSQLSPV